MRIAVVDTKHIPLMPTMPQRARRWIEQGKAIGKWSDLGIWYVQLIVEPSDRQIQSITAGVDPGKLYSGIGVQSTKSTLFMAHLVLPFKRVTERMEFRLIMRRARRGRRINRKVEFSARAHRQKRFNNRRGSKLPPSIKANRQLEQRVLTELKAIFPISTVVYEVVKANGNKGFSPVMVGQKWQLEQLKKRFPKVATCFGWETANLRRQLGLTKASNKAEQSPRSHAVDGVALAAGQFISYQKFYSAKADGAMWVGSVQVTDSEFRIIRRPPISRRQLHLAQPAKGGNRRKYGGTVTRHGLRKGDFVKAERKGQAHYGWVSGETDTQVSVSDINWKRISQFSKKKVALIHRATGLIEAKAAC